MASYFNMTIVGNLGRDPEMRYTPSGKPVTSFSLAVNETWTGADGQKHEEVTWFRVTCWEKLAELAAQYLRKGRLVLVEARKIAASAYTNKAGDSVASLEVTAKNIKFLDGGHAGEEPAAANVETGVSAEDLPF